MDAAKGWGPGFAHGCGKKVKRFGLHFTSATFSDGCGKKLVDKVCRSSNFAECGLHSCLQTRGEDLAADCETPGLRKVVELSGFEGCTFLFFHLNESSASRFGHFQKWFLKTEEHKKFQHGNSHGNSKTTTLNSNSKFPYGLETPIVSQGVTLGVQILS